MDQLVSILTAVAEVMDQYGTLILLLLLLLPILLMWAVLFPIMMVLGYKRGVFRALIATGCSLVSGGVAVFASKIVADLAAKLALDPLLGALQSLIPPDFSVLYEMMNFLTYSIGLLRGVLSFLVALILYFLLLLILLIVSKSVVDHLVRIPLAHTNEKAGMKLGGMFIGMADAIILSLLFLLPFYTVLGNGVQFVGTASDAIETALAEEEEAENNTAVDIVADVCETVSGFCATVEKTPPVFIAKLPVANFTESVFGTFKCDGHYFNLFEIVHDGGYTVAQALTFIGTKPAEYGEAEIAVVDGVIATARDNPFFYGLLHDGITVGLKLSDELIPDAKNLTTDLLHVAVDSLKESSVEDISDSFDTFSDVFAISVRHGILANMNNKEQLTETLTEESFIVETVTVLRSCNILSDVLDKALLVSLDYVNLSEGELSDVDFKDSIDIVKQNIEAQMANGRPDLDGEIAAFKCLIHGITRLSTSTDSFSRLDIATIDAEALSDTLLGFGLHPYIGTNGVKALLKAVLPTLNDKTGDIFNDDFIEKATDALIYDIENYGKDSAHRFRNLLVSAKSLTVAVTKLSVTDLGEVDKMEIHDLVGVLLTDTTPETADILKTAITGEVLGKLSDTKADTEVVSGMIGDLMTNMAEAQFESEVEQKREQEGITEMTMLAMTAQDRLNEPVPEGSTAIEQAVGGDIDAFIEKVTSSEVMMGTLESTIEKNDGKMDPTASFGNLSDQDKAAVLASCENAEKESTDENISKKLDLICQFMGITRE